jgi:hypothetical protein
MSEMAERVAKALCDCSVLKPKWEDLSRDQKRWYYRAAYAAIDAMREPTEKMLEAGPPEPYMDASVWAAMMEAALPEEKDPDPADAIFEQVA